MYRTEMSETAVSCSDSPRWMWWYHWFCWLLSASGVICILIAHEHYSIDVVIGYFATTRTFWWYHTMANTHVRARNKRSVIFCNV